MMALVNLTIDPGPSGPVDVFDVSWRSHVVVHQATGALAAQFGISTAEALARLRAYAFGHLQPLDEVAHDVMSGELRITEDTADEVDKRR